MYTVSVCDMRFSVYRWQLQISSKVKNFTDVIHFNVNGFNLDMYSLKMALSCRNRSE